MTMVSAPCSYCSSAVEDNGLCLPCYRRAGICITSPQHPLNRPLRLQLLAMSIQPGVARTVYLNPEDQS